jgi:hypothetical protein
MQLTCPSCGRKHKSEKYKGQFDIACPCGYSILLPDEEALAAEINPPPSAPELPVGMDAVPAALEEEDQKLLIESSTQEPLPAASVEMTPPEDLPTGMVYDPFELPKGPEAWTEQGLDPKPDEGLFAETESPQATESVIQSIVDRTQLASLGQLIGPEFDLSFGDLEEEPWRLILMDLQRLVDERPWLKRSLDEKKISLGDWSAPGELNAIPEVLAVELYLRVVQAGGRCEFKLSVGV